MYLRGRGLASLRPGGQKNFEAVEGNLHNPCGPDGVYSGVYIPFVYHHVGDLTTL